MKKRRTQIKFAPEGSDLSVVEQGEFGGSSKIGRERRGSFIGALSIYTECL